MRRACSLVWLVIPLAMAVGCRPKRGAQCKPGTSACADARTALVCSDQGLLVEQPCGGECKKSGDRLVCTGAISAPRSACASAGEYACTGDKRTLLQCDAGHYAIRAACMGPEGCKGSGKTYSCDSTYAVRQSPCVESGRFACAVSRAELLVCQAGVWSPEWPCRGPQGCSLGQGGDQARCDMSYAVSGDPCSQPGYVACSTDARTELVCRGASFIPSRSCPGGCKVAPGQRVDCM